MGSFTEISNLRDASLMLFPERENKKYILNCSVALMKCSFDLRPAINKALAKYAVLMTPSQRGSQFPIKESQVTLHLPYQSIPINKPTSFVVWNIRGANNDVFKRNVYELLHTHRSCMVALLETRMENHERLKEEFHFDDFLEIAAQGRACGVVLIWLTNMVTVVHIRQADQELHAMIQVYPNYFLGYLVSFTLVLKFVIATCCGKI